MQNIPFILTRIAFLAVFLCLAGTTALAAPEIHWYLAASLTKPAKEIVHHFNQQEKECEVFPIVGGSGQLLSKISMAKIGDLYSPASAEFLAKTRALGLVADSRVLLAQTPVFGISVPGKQKISTFEDLTTRIVKIALGNPKTMALGNTYLKIEQKMGADLTSQIRRNKIVEAINVNQVVSYLLLGVVDAGLIFDTVAHANSLSYVSIPEEYNVKTRAYMIRLTFSKSENQHCVNRLVSYVFTRGDIFSKYGFKLDQ